MDSKISWNILQQLRKVWVRVVSYALLAVITVILAQLVAPFIPFSLSVSIGAEAVDQVLNILASSMLAVTTFSLAIATSAFAAAASNATPRATALLQEDTTAQNVLATFLGAFLYSLVGIIALKAGYYTSTGRLVLFVVTGLVIATVVVMLLRWISHLMSFGRMADTLDRVERATARSLRRRNDSPFLHGRPLVAGIPESCHPVLPRETGYVQHIDIGALDEIATELELKIWLAVLPGTFVHRVSPLFFLDQTPRDDKAVDRMLAAFTIRADRTFDQDPRFGLIVLSEIASRALSPAVNDPGTAIGVIGRLVRVLSDWDGRTHEEIRHESVFVPPISPRDMIDDAFRPIARDGAGIVEVQIRLLKSLNALARISPAFSEPATAMAAELLVRARKCLTPGEFDLLEGLAGEKPAETR